MDRGSNQIRLLLEGLKIGEKRLKKAAKVKDYREVDGNLVYHLPTFTEGEIELLLEILNEYHTGTDFHLGSLPFVNRMFAIECVERALTETFIGGLDPSFWLNKGSVDRKRSHRLGEKDMKSITINIKNVEHAMQDLQDKTSVFAKTLQDVGRQISKNAGRLGRSRHS